MISFPNAKVNLGLNIVGVRPNGYHDLETVFYPIELCDVLEIVPSRSGKTTLECYGRKVDCPMENNLVYKAFELMRKEFDVPAVEMYLYKHIPDGAGLGGGSSDASSALKMLNAIFSLGLSDGDLAKRAAAIGADCPFFIYNKPCRKAAAAGDARRVGIDQTCLLESGARTSRLCAGVAACQAHDGVERHGEKRL